MKITVGAVLGIAVIGITVFQLSSGSVGPLSANINQSCVDACMGSAVLPNGEFNQCSLCQDDRACRAGGTPEKSPTTGDPLTEIELCCQSKCGGDLTAICGGFAPPVTLNLSQDCRAACDYLPAGLSDACVFGYCLPFNGKDRVCSFDGINNECGCSFCGNGELDPGETCDPETGGEEFGVECRSNCTYCGDGNVDTDAGETCDDNSAECRSALDSNACTYCGDGIVQGGIENCDGGAQCTGSCECPAGMVPDGKDPPGCKCVNDAGCSDGKACTKDTCNVQTGQCEPSVDICGGSPQDYCEECLPAQLGTWSCQIPTNDPNFKCGQCCQSPDKCREVTQWDCYPDYSEREDCMEGCPPVEGFDGCRWLCMQIPPKEVCDPKSKNWECAEDACKINGDCQQDPACGMCINGSYRLECSCSNGRCAKNYVKDCSCTTGECSLCAGDLLNNPCASNPNKPCEFCWLEKTLLPIPGPGPVEQDTCTPYPNAEILWPEECGDGSGGSSKSEASSKSSSSSSSSMSSESSQSSQSTSSSSCAYSSGSGSIAPCSASYSLSLSRSASSTSSRSSSSESPEGDDTEDSDGFSSEENDDVDEGDDSADADGYSSEEADDGEDFSSSSSVRENSSSSSGSTAGDDGDTGSSSSSSSYAQCDFCPACVSCRRCGIGLGNVCDEAECSGLGLCSFTPSVFGIGGSCTGEVDFCAVCE